MLSDQNRPVIKPRYRLSVNTSGKSPSASTVICSPSIPVLALRNASLHLWYERSDQTHEPVDGCNAGLMDLVHVRLPDNATYYMCGPLPFMQAVRSALIDRQVAPRDIQYEVFGPDLWQADFE